ncbi:DUF3072 domain-containing protein [Wenxinia marina]|uniref:Uncharacterized protein n=1 Tax=Wenxinia marina DSM 24838 TaxID=1123501 RepID=A0A0D0Q7X8_9RHOB|nr:DUF3072 domain-containing protein [Wenxinia marina]KIQ68547.1 hypothetical protein Wenmar_02818 [Wenxinia marina DSM 24838]GGL66790.1 hypothetical protein GCM10011392_21610 [Wenxinia marina]
MAQTMTSPMTRSQKEELAQLCRKTGEQVEKVLTRAQAKCRIETLKLLDTLPRR